MSNIKAKTVAVIGAGPAGMAATLQLYRFGIKTYLFEQNSPGSLLQNAWSVENYLGCYPGESGVKLLQKFCLHLRQNKIKLLPTRVEQLGYNEKTQTFTITTRAKKYITNYAIIASGSKPKLLINSASNYHSQIFYNVFPLLRKRNKTILIVGAGDAAFDNALNLVKYNKIIVCNRSSQIDALPLLVNKLKRHKNITYLSNHRFLGFLAEPINKKTIVILAKKEKNVYIEADYVLAAIGRLPQKDFYNRKLQVISKLLMKKKKLLLAGDVKNDRYRQVAIAVGDGIKAAMIIAKNQI